MNKLSLVFVLTLSATSTSAIAASLALPDDFEALESVVTGLMTDATQVQTDLTTVENTLPTLQPLVSGSCAIGSSIRQIFSGGTVTCETDDEGPWSFDGDAYVTGGTRVGIGTTAPAASLQIDAPVGVDPFRARVESSTKLRVHNNGSVSVGSASQGPDNGLYVLGSAGFGTSAPTARLTVVADINWQTSLNNNGTGGGTWYVGTSSAAWNIGGGKYVISPTNSSVNPALVIDSNRDVGIGVTDPLSRLHLGGGTDVSPIDGGYLIMGDITGANIAMDSNEIMARSNGAVAALALNAEGGLVRINSSGSRDTDALSVKGRVLFDNGGNSGMRMTATNSSPTNALLEPTQFEEGLLGSSVRPFWRVYSREFYAESPLQYMTYSDRSLKQNVVPIPGALSTILALEGVTYVLSKHPMDTKNRKLSTEEQFDRENQLGFIAQDLEQVLPQLVSEDASSGLKTVGYMGLIPVLVEAIKTQQRQIDAQGEQIERLREQIQ